MALADGAQEASMDPIQIILALAVVAAIVLVAWLAMERRRAGRLRSQFGGEYDRIVRETGSRRAAEQELASRRERVAALDIQPLSADDQARYSAAWQSVQHQFVDDPSGAIDEADRLIGEVLERRGYPVDDGDFDRRAADLSVDHADVIDRYRAAHEIATRDDGGVLPTDTESLRQAMVHYRALFTSLLGTPEPEPALEAAGARRTTS
jgi:hypothetical protein